MSRKKLIINADGFGFTFGNNRGILECLEVGVVKSVSVNANFPAVEEVTKLKDFPDVSVGIHLNLSVGPCVSEPKDIPDLVDEKGEFLGSEFDRKALRGQIPHEQMVRELTAQVEKLTEYGIEITHWDSHQTKHLYRPFFKAAIEVAKKFNIQRMRTHDHHIFSMGRCRKIRATIHLLVHPRRAFIYAASKYLMRKARRAGMRMADRLITPGLLDSARKYQYEFWEQLFWKLPEGVSEIYAHPGYPDETLRNYSRYVDERLEELKILRDPALRQKALQAGVELISFREV